jgi:nucleotide-binding universal stress UspA family protein
MSAPHTIVVGVDGSDCSRSALEFALKDAARRGAAVRVVRALPDTDDWAAVYSLPPAFLEDLTGRFAKEAHDVVEAAVREGGSALAHVPVQVDVLRGSPADVLVSRARDADLLVVGHRGLGGFRSATLGSVGLQCVLHASVPVTVVRPAPHAR